MTARRPASRSLTDREQQIVAAVADHRVLTGNQIQRLFFPTGAGTRAGAIRRTQRTCKGLVDHHILDTLDRTVGGVRAGSAGFCYVLGYQGQRLIRPGRRARTTATLGAAFVDHAVSTADIAVTLTEAEREHSLEIISIETEPDCWRPFVRRTGQVETLKPDLFVDIAVGDTERRWFVEVDRATESLVRIENKCRTYLTYLNTGREQELHGVFPKVLWTTPSVKRAEQIRGVVSGLPPPAGRLFETCVHHQAIDFLKGGPT